MASTYYHGANDGIQVGNNYDNITTEIRLSKRPKTSHHDDVRAPPHTQYTIAWVCALYIEMAAAQAMLDELHERLPTQVDDNNYILGSIDRHNVVIACLPEGQYGTNNAAIVMTNMKRTFPAIRACLMVGIGGGVPGKTDVRLGDVVVGTRVMQCDLGKLIGDGQLQRTAIPRLSHSLFGTTISTVRSKHEHHSSRVHSILQQKLEGQQSYSRPTSPDLLFFASYDHETPTESCDGCNHSKLVPRSRRLSNEARIHYGAIASGNQVMRNGETRDMVARELDVICFEMESAGLMDVLPCLPIRGICDYADSHKSKEWQRYAAATAAAYARELLEELPVTESHQSVNATIDSYQHKSSKSRQQLLDSFKFDQIDSRKITIKEEEERTCRWFLCHPDYEAWLDPARLTQHRGFLWISGKPGAGKSTIMKFAYMSMKRNPCQTHAVTASFFFNARGTDLEKSTSGMYRSLLLQLLEGYPDLEAVLGDSDLIPRNQKGCPSLVVLKTIFENAVCTLGKRTFTCFIDALDECDEQQVVEMVQYFEALTKRSTEKGISFRTCFSSRHYPYIFIHRGIRLTLEHQLGHTEDLSTYVISRLNIKEPDLVAELQASILGKAAGVFMWVVLVVGILNKEYRRGGMALRKRLAELPSDLTALFDDILKRDKDDMEALQLCILWVLYAKRPLSPQELYHALWIGLCPKNLVDGHIPDATVSNVGVEPDTCRITRSITSYSKGLAETTNSDQPIVQFIHESVRDFLIKDKGVYQLWPELGLDCEGLGHEKLKQGCNLYMNHALVCKSVTMLLSESVAYRRERAWTEVSKDYPLLGYANQHVLFHANAAAKVVPQDEFLSSLTVSNWIDTNNVCRKSKYGKYSRNTSLYYILADRGYPELIRAKPKEDPQTQVHGEMYKYPLFVALAKRDEDSVTAILDPSSSFHDGTSLTEGLEFNKDFKKYKSRTPLTWAAQEGRIGIVKLLLQRGADIDGMDSGGLTPLLRTSENGHETIAKLLIDSGANINACDEDSRTSLHKSVVNGHEAMTRLLIAKQADVNACDNSGRTPLYLSVTRYNEAITMLLVDSGAGINASNKFGETPLHQSVTKGNEPMTRLLVDKGADINAINSHGETPLHQSVAKGNEVIAKFLIDKGANINAGDQNGWTSLHQSTANGHEETTRLLVDRGADINATNLFGETPLHQSVAKGHEAITRFILDRGAKVDICNTSGCIPLHRCITSWNTAIARLLIEKGADFNAYDENGWTILHHSVAKGHEAMTRLILEMGAQVDICGKRGWTPLQQSTTYGHEAITRLLVDNGADVNACGEDGWTPLQRSLKNGHEELARLFIEKGAVLNANVRDKDGWTPLERSSAKGLEAFMRLLIENQADIQAGEHSRYAALQLSSQNGHESIVRLLIEHGANVNTTDDSGQTPLHRAAMMGHEMIARLLIEASANVEAHDQHGLTPLQWSSAYGHEATSRLLIAMGANVNTKDISGQTPLDQATKNGFQEVERLLISENARSGLDSINQ